MVDDTHKRYDIIYKKENAENVFTSQNERMQKCYPFKENGRIQHIGVCKKLVDNGHQVTNPARIK